MSLKAHVYLASTMTKISSEVTRMNERSYKVEFDNFKFILHHSVFCHTT